MMRPDSICSVAGSAYDRALRPASTSTVTTAEKRRSMRDDTMWQLYEWQQRQASSRQSLAQPTGSGATITIKLQLSKLPQSSKKLSYSLLNYFDFFEGHYGTLPSTKTMGNISEHAAVHSIPTSPSHGTLALYNTLPPPCKQGISNAGNSHAEISSPIVREDGTLDRLHRTHPAKVKDIQV